MFERRQIVAILTVYKRDYLSLQLGSLFNQSVCPDLIVVLQNDSLTEINLDKYEGDDRIVIVRSSYNTKFWGRFAIAQIINSEYILILDDDIVPESRWVENCYRLLQEKNCVVCANGRGFKNDQGFGDSGEVGDDTQTAFGGHSWFFRKEWLKYMWEFPPISYETGEDITFCASCKIVGGIETWVPRQSLSDQTSAHMNNFSGDENASWRSSNWGEKRLEICDHFLKLGWK